MQVESRPAIAASWRRSALAGLSRETSGVADIGEVNLTTALVRAADPVLHALADQLGDSPVCLMLADRDGHVVFQAAGDRRLRTALEGQAIVVGSRLGEELRGTNGLGTPLEVGSPVAISGAEHFLHAYGGFSCYGSPIRHPLTRRIEGAMDLTIPAEEPNPLFRPLVMRAVRDIETRLVDSARPADRRLFLAFEEATRRRSAPVAVLDADTVLMNRGFSDHLGTAGPEVLRTLLPATAAEGTVVRRLDLGTGSPVEITGTVVEGVLGGALFRVRKVAADTVAHRSRPRPTVRPSLVVSGEPGSGRSRRVAEAAGDAPMVTLDAATTITGTERDWAERFTQLAAEPERIVVVDDAQLLGERLCTLVGRSLDDRAAARIWLVTGPTADLPPHVAALVARCPERLETTPLRERLHELPALVAALSTAQGADRPLVLTARALAALSEHPWPGNLVELAVLVQELTADPVVGPVDLPALPPRYRPGGRVLAGREHAERVAIVGALQSAEGNKSIAAARLGISRTTLYNRLRALAISEQQYVSNS